MKQDSDSNKSTTHQSLVVHSHPVQHHQASSSVSAAAFNTQHIFCGAHFSRANSLELGINVVKSSLQLISDNMKISEVLPEPHRPTGRQ